MLWIVSFVNDKSMVSKMWHKSRACVPTVCLKGYHNGVCHTVLTNVTKLLLPVAVHALVKPPVITAAEKCRAEETTR